MGEKQPFWERKACFCAGLAVRCKEDLIQGVALEDFPGFSDVRLRPSGSITGSLVVMAAFLRVELGPDLLGSPWACRVNEEPCKEELGGVVFCKVRSELLRPPLGLLDPARYLLDPFS